MAQHDYNIANQTAPNARTDINNALSAIATNNSGGSAPSTTYANQWWYDTGANLLRIRNEANTGWIVAAYLDGSTWKIMDNTQVVNTSGTQTGLLGDQATSTWQSGTGSTESLVSPAKVKAAIDANVSGLGINQSWQNVTSSRSLNSVYRNTTGKPISVSVVTQPGGNNTVRFQVSTNSSMSGYIVVAANFDIDGNATTSAIVPHNVYYRISLGNGYVVSWSELR